MKHLTREVIIDNAEYTVTESRRKQKYSKRFNNLPRYKRGVRKYYILYDIRRSMYYGDRSKEGVIKSYLKWSTYGRRQTEASL